MLRLLRFLVGLALFIAFIWFGATVRLGEKTLFDHLKAIGGSPETRDLVEGTKQAARPIVEKVQQQHRRDAGVDGGRAAAAEKIDERDRKELDRRVRRHTRPTSAPPPR